MLNRNLLASIFSLVLLAGASGAEAQATRTWISGDGDDTYPCGRTSPCKTFAGAITKTAAEGEINAIDPGGFGGVTITKSITINGQGTMAGALIGAGSNGIIVNAGVNDVVTLRNLVINGSGVGLNGIRIFQARQVHIENCTIENFVNRGILVDNTSNAIQVFIHNTVIRNNTGASTPAGNSGAILLRPTSSGTVSALLDHVLMDQTTFGLRVEGNARATVNDSTASGNTTFGFHAITPGPNAASIILERVAVSNNATGVQAEGSAFASVRLSATIVTSNSVGLSSVTGGQLLSWGNNRNAGNGTNGAPTAAVVPLQ